jgi:hypothetical protein
MTDDSNPPNRIFIGSFESGVNTLVIPSQVLERANIKLDAERARRENIASEAALALMASCARRCSPCLEEVDDDDLSDRISCSPGDP